MPVENSVIDLSTTDVMIAAALVLISGGISVALKLKMEGKLALASFRTVAQLLLIGFVLQKVFEISTLPALIPVVLFMLLTAAHTAVGRPARTYADLVLHSHGRIGAGKDLARHHPRQ